MASRASADAKVGRRTTGAQLVEIPTGAEDGVATVVDGVEERVEEGDGAAPVVGVGTRAATPTNKWRESKRRGRGR